MSEKKRRNEWKKKCAEKIERNGNVETEKTNAK